ncbi:MAG: hypothetical protein ISR99_00245 [Parcubacteria group bacterium]|nr:hypothetical protein [Parcubacteria group bacterium]
MEENNKTPEQNIPDQVPNVETGGDMSEEKKSSGPFVGIVIIVLVLVVGGLYFWGSKLSKERQDLVTPEEIQAEADPSLEALSTQSTSDAVADIEADLDTTDLGGLDAELADIDTEFSL